MSEISPQIPTQAVDQASSAESDQNIIIAAKGGGIAFAGSLFNYGSSFVFSIIVARMLGAEQLGLYSLALTITGFLSAVSFLGLNGGLLRYIPIAKRERNKAKIWGTIQIGTVIPTLVGLLLMFVLLLTVRPVSIEWFDAPALIPILWLAAFTIPLHTLAICLSNVAQAFKHFKYQVYALDIAFNLAKLVLTVIFLVVGLGVMGVIGAYLAAWIISLVMLVYYVHRIFPLNRPINSAERHTGEMFHFSLPLHISRLLNTFGGNLETLVLGVFGIVADVGVYSAILRLSAIGNLFFSALRNISVPLISELYSQEKYDELGRLYQAVTKWSIMFNYPVFLTILVFSRPLLSIFGDDFTVGATGLVILAASNLFNAATGTCGVVINMSGRTKLSLVNSVIYLVTTIILDLLLIPRFQLIGAAWAGALTIVINNLIRMIQVYFIINGLLPFNLTFLKPIAAGLVAAGLVYLLNTLFLVDSPLLQFIIFTPILWGVYTGLIWVFRLSAEEQMILDKLKKRLFKKRKKSN